MGPPASGTYDICPVCFWEDDQVQLEDPIYAGGANNPSLLESRENFQRLGAIEGRFTTKVRLPLPEELPRALTLYRPVGQKELDLIAAAGFTRFPPRLSGQPIFYPVLNERYADQIARDWNTKDAASGNVGYVTRFNVRWECATRYEPQKVGGHWHWELWVPAEELDEFNASIVGRIEVVGQHRPE